MPNLRYRWALPVGHTVVDLVLLATWIWQGSLMWKGHKGDTASTPALRTVALLQDATVGWDPTYIPTPPKFVFLLSGTLPAGIVSMNVRPEAGWQRPGSLWDPVWLAIHETVAIPLWFLIGMWIDKGRSRLGKAMRFYLMGRGALVVLDAAFGIANFAVVIQGCFWIWLAGYGIVRGVQWMTRTVKGAAS
jgi:hypothetical protein